MTDPIRDKIFTVRFSEQEFNELMEWAHRKGYGNLSSAIRVACLEQARANQPQGIKPNLSRQGTYTMDTNRRSGEDRRVDTQA